MSFVEKTKKIIEKKGIDAEIREHKKWGKESEKVAEIFEIPLENVIKSLLIFLDETPYLAVVQGDKRLDLKKIEKITGKKTVLARVSDIKELGFEFGGIPCIGSELRMIVDQRVMDEEYIVGSAGSPYTGIKITPEDLVRLNNAEVLSICRGA
ncbi:MAG: YbaK/EbsC family protein [Euryarchaeota archaeon]|nr:YbaK/EbsC family protein [Euryarchaeota archaeon]